MTPMHVMPATNENNRILIKGIIVGIMILLMLIPGYFVSNLVAERQSRQSEVVNEVSGKWAGKQTITGPVLLLPYREVKTAADGKTTTTMNTAYILPDDLHITGNIDPKEKKRSLYSVMLYHADIKLTGKFNPLPFEALQIDPESVVWKDARLVINTEDVRGIDDQVQLEWNGAKHFMEAGVPENKQLNEGISAPVSINAQDPSSFSVTLSLRGSEQLYFTPVGKTTETDINAAWKDPAFDGKYLPLTSEVTDKKFKAHWKILPLSHTYPQYWKNNAQDLAKAAFGVRLIQTVDGYSKTNRSIKYAILFVALTFAFFFFLEILQKRRVHPIQYMLVGIALTIFYTLLLSISEYTGFNIAYFIASAATVSLIALYVRGIFKSNKTAVGFTVALASLYTYIFILIQSEDYALLFGSIGLFVIMAIIMHYSRKIDWYGAAGHEEHVPLQNDGNILPENELTV